MGLHRVGRDRIDSSMHMPEVATVQWRRRKEKDRSKRLYNAKVKYMVSFTVRARTRLKQQEIQSHVQERF